MSGGNKGNKKIRLYSFEDIKIWVYRFSDISQCVICRLVL